MSNEAFSEFTFLVVKQNFYLYEYDEVFIAEMNVTTKKTTSQNPVLIPIYSCYEDFF